MPSSRSDASDNSNNHDSHFAGVLKFVSPEVDPVNGEFILIQAVLGSDINDFTGRIEFWKYRLDTDTWTKLDESVVPALEGWWAKDYPFAVVAVPVPRYGVIMFMSGAGPKSKVYLYKHATEGGA